MSRARQFRVPIPHDGWIEQPNGSAHHPAFDVPQPDGTVLRVEMGRFAPDDDHPIYGAAGPGRVYLNWAHLHPTATALDFQWVMHHEVRLIVAEEVLV